MTISRKLLCATYALIGGIAFVIAWGNILGLLGQYGFWEGTLRFWQDVLVNEASRFIAVDVLFLGLAVVVWMILEARRLHIPGVWLYVGFGLLVAISLAVPLFMIHRERRLAALEPNSSAGNLYPMDVVGVAALGLAFTGFGVFALLR